MGKKKSKAAPKAKRQAVKKVEIRVEHNGWANEYSFGRPGAETWSAGYCRPFTAKRGALRDEKIKKFIAKGGRVEFVNNY